MKHTPGPWHIEQRSHFDVRILPQDGPRTTTIASMGNWSDEYFAEELANARLIAAAPELLEALRLAAETGFEYHNRPDLTLGTDCPICLAFQKIEALIAKIEGAE